MTARPRWQPGPTAFADAGVGAGPVPPGELHVWRARPPRAPEAAARLAGCLSDEERARAATFVRERDRQQSIGARALLRHVLARYLCVAPAAVPLALAPGGKPYLVGRSDVGFNVSHADGLALFVVGPSPDVGVDVERLRDDLDVASVAAIVCTPGERDHLATLPPDARRRAFFECWTRKEAVAKAWGSGLAEPLESLDVGRGEGAYALPQTPPRGRSGARAWTVISLAPAEGYVGAVAAPAGPWRLRRWAWAEDAGSAAG